MRCQTCSLESRTLICALCALSELGSECSEDTILQDFRHACLCVYCGERAGDREHVWPKSLGGTLTVPSCRDCNQLAGNSRQASISERREYIKTRLLSKYAGLLSVPVWSEEDLAALGDKLEEHVGSALAAQRVVLSRLDFMTKAADFAGHTAITIKRRVGRPKGKERPHRLMVCFSPAEMALLESKRLPDETNAALARRLLFTKA